MLSKSSSQLSGFTKISCFAWCEVKQALCFKYMPYVSWGIKKHYLQLKTELLPALRCPTNFRKIR